MAKILLVEDEVNIASFIERGLHEFGYDVHVACDGESAWISLSKESYHLLILDVIMPGMSGLQLCRMFREKYGYQVPVIMLTALGTADDIVGGLEAGADDYLVKPFRFIELEARIRALLRRAGMEVSEPLELSLQCGDLSLDPATRRATRKKKVINLTIKEYRLLECLLKHKGTAVSREDLLKYVWEEKEFDRTNVVDVYVNYVRGKIDKDFSRKLIRTVAGIGYMIDA